MKTSSFNIIQFLLVYGLLAGWFYVYVGITTPGGESYWPFLDHNLNVMEWLAWLLAKASMLVLKISGFAVYQRAPNNVTIQGAGGVTILWACLGFGVMSFWTAFVTAHKATAGFKLKWCARGLSIITALNIARIVLIAIANRYHWEAITRLEPHETFNIASYAVLFVLIGWFVWRYRQYEKKKAPAAATGSVQQAQLTTLA